MAQPSSISSTGGSSAGGSSLLSSSLLSSSQLSPSLRSKNSLTRVVLVCIGLSIAAQGSYALGVFFGRSSGHGHMGQNTSARLAEVPAAADPHQAPMADQLAMLKRNPEDRAELGSFAKLGPAELGSKDRLSNSEAPSNSEALEVVPPALEQKSLAQAPAAVEQPSEERGVTSVTHIVKLGDNWGSIWVQHGAPRVGGILAAKAAASVGVSSGALREKERLEIQLSPKGDIIGFKKKLGKTRALVLEGNSQAGYRAHIEELSVVSLERTVSGTIQVSLAQAARDNAVPYSVIDDLVDLLGERVEFSRALHTGDAFSITYEERRLADGSEVDPGPIALASLTSAGRTIVAIRHESPKGSAHYFDEKGQVIGDYFLRYPVRFSRISSTFSDARLHPILGINRPHLGVDFAAPTGTPVRSIGPGIVEFAGWNPTGGYTIRIRHNNRYTTTYLHLSKIAPSVSTGRSISRGELIGAVGQTGLASGPHLHFGLFDNGQYVNPLTTQLPTSNGDLRLPARLLTLALAKVEKQHAEARLVAQRAVVAAPIG